MTPYLNNVNTEVDDLKEEMGAKIDTLSQQVSSLTATIQRLETFITMQPGLSGAQGAAGVGDAYSPGKFIEELKGLDLMPVE